MKTSVQRIRGDLSKETPKRREEILRAIQRKPVVHKLPCGCYLTAEYNYYGSHKSGDHSLGLRVALEVQDKKDPLWVTLVFPERVSLTGKERRSQLKHLAYETLLECVHDKTELDFLLNSILGIFSY